MSPKSKTAARPEPKQAVAKPDWRLLVLALASIGVAIIGILVLKERDRPVVTLSAAQTSSPTAQGSLTPQGTPGAVDRSLAVNGPSRSTSPADQLNRALASSRPVLVFMHSTTCQSCIDMMKVVDQVYPEFAGEVALVDVDVNDDANGLLLQKLGLRYIPTIVVFNKEGQASQNIGGMKADAFRTFLRQRALGG